MSEWGALVAVVRSIMSSDVLRLPHLRHVTSVVIVSAPVRRAALLRGPYASIQITADTYGHLFPSADDGSELAAAERALWR
jgi:hypothetical protein